jgi:predicted acyl esterase
MPNPIKDITRVDATSFPYIFEENVTIPLANDGGLIRCNVYRPKGVANAPVLVTYGPYGKDLHYKEYAAISFPPSYLMLIHYLASPSTPTRK